MPDDAVVVEVVANYARMFCPPYKDAMLVQLLRELQDFPAILWREFARTQTSVKGSSLSADDDRDRRFDVVSSRNCLLRSDEPISLSVEAFKSISIIWPRA